MLASINVLLCLILQSTIASQVNINVIVGSNATENICHQDASIGNSSYWCSSLQDALELLNKTSTSKGQAEDILFIIELESSVIHYITDPVVITHTSVYITSYGDINQNALVLCQYVAKGLHTLYFNQSQTVLFSGLEFQGCPLPITILEADNVTIEYSIFSSFSEAVFDIHNCFYVSIHNSTFTNNYGTGISTVPYRGNTGGVSITYNQMKAITTNNTNPILYVSNSTFINNSATASANIGTNIILSQFVFRARGGGLGVFVHENNFNVTAEICGCLFYKNMATAFGAGIYLLFRGNAVHTSVVSENTFESNMASLGGGGIIFSGLGTLGVNRLHFNFVRRCTFICNEAIIGAGIYVFVNLNGGRSNIASIEDCQFSNNSVATSTGTAGDGAAIAFDFEQQDNIGRELSIPNTVTNCTFRYNVGENSIISVAFHPLEFLGTNIFISNSGSVLRLISVAVILGGRIEFINNKAIDGTAIVLQSFSQLILSDNLQMIFNRNSGRFGASISVSGTPVVPTFQRLYYNRQCFLILKSDPKLPPKDWNKVAGINITFTNNSALFGSAIFIRTLSGCTWTDTNAQNAFNKSYFPNWPIFNVKQNNYNTAFTDALNQTYSIVTDPVGLKLFGINNTVEGWPGKTLNFSITALDELGTSTGSIVRISFEAKLKELPMIDINPNTLFIESEEQIVDMTFSAISNSNNSDVINIANTEGYIIFDSNGVLLSSKETEGAAFTILNSTSCIAGYKLFDISTSANKKECQCDNQEENRILFCENDQDSIIIEDGMWSASIHESSLQRLFFYLCPSGYCRCFFNTSFGDRTCAKVYTNSDPNRQCVCGRKGILCGECAEPDTGVSVLTNTCSRCNSGNSTLILLLIVICIFTMVAIILIDKPLPQWCYPVIFYLQIAPIATLHFPLSFNKTGNYLNYISNLLSFYFPYDFCLHNELTPLGSYALKYIPAITALTIMLAIIPARVLIARKFSSLRFRKFHGHGAWAITLSVYTLTLHTSTTILNCPAIPDINGQISPRWYIDGSVECFKGNHIFLALFAMAWILILLSIIPVILLLEYKGSVFTLDDQPLQIAYKKKFEFWYGIELSRRIVAVLLITVYPEKSILLSLYIMVVLLTYSYARPFKTKSVNYLETGLLITFLILLKLRSSPFFQDTFTFTTGQRNYTSVPSCDGGAVVVSTLATILSVIYYLPVLVGLVCLIIFIGVEMYKCTRVILSQKAKRIGKRNPTVLADGISDFSTVYTYQRNDKKKSNIQTTVLVLDTL